jgi:hypothetical protein
MPNDQSANGTESLDRSKPMATGGDDGKLLTLEAQLDALIGQLLAAERSNVDRVASADQLPAEPDNARDGSQDAPVSEAQRKRVEAILARLYPIERAIMTAPAYTIIGLAVKARHAAYVMSQYWEEPADKIDWEAGNPATHRGGLQRRRYAIVISDTRKGDCARIARHRCRKVVHFWCGDPPPAGRSPATSCTHEKPTG